MDGAGFSPCLLSSGDDGIATARSCARFLTRDFAAILDWVICRPLTRYLAKYRPAAANSGAGALVLRQASRQDKGPSAANDANDADTRAGGRRVERKDRPTPVLDLAHREI